MVLLKPDLEQPQLLTSKELNDLRKDFGISKDGAQLLRYRLHSKHVLDPRTNFLGIEKVKQNSYLIFFE